MWEGGRTRTKEKQERGKGRKEERNTTGRKVERGGAFFYPLRVPPSNRRQQPTTRDKVSGHTKPLCSTARTA